MGINVNVSRPIDLKENELLLQFCGKQHFPADSEFFDKLLSFTINSPNNSEEQLNLDSKLESFLESIIQNNLTSGNFGSLITVFLNRAADILSLNDSESHLHVYKLYNCIFVLRIIIKYILEIGSEFLLLQHFEALPKQQQQTDNNGTVSVSVETPSTSKTRNIDGTKFESFLESIFNLICVIPQKEFTYHLHLECVNVIIVLCSVYLTNQQTTEKSTIFKTIYKCRYASTVLATLLHFVSRMNQAPSTPYGAHLNAGGSFVFGLAESFWSMLTFSKKPVDVLDTTDLPKSFKDHYPLANQSLLLILILTNHNADDSVDVQNNPYRHSLINCSNSTDLVKDDVDSFKIDFTGLYQTLCRITHLDQTTLLLYLLLHRNEKFYKFVMAQPNLQDLVIPILQILYNAPDSSSHHIYMSLIVLLILSEDDEFNKSVHNIILKNVIWYTERSISEISLGGLLILVIIRTVQYNMLKVRDKYLHTNCLACLANMSSQFRFLHQYVSQRLVSLFETLAKKHARLQSQLESIKQSELNPEAATTSTVVEVTTDEDVVSLKFLRLQSSSSNEFL
jgi:dymeclin